MTIREIAAIAGVSPAAVSLVMNNKKGVSEETRRRVMSVVEECGYAPALQKKKVERFRLMVLKFRAHGIALEENQGFIASIIDRIESECRRFAFDLIMCNCEAKTAAATIRELMQNPPDGVIVIGTELREPDYPLLKLFTVPVVVLDNNIILDNIDSVVMANRALMANVVHYLYQQGYREIGYYKNTQPQNNNNHTNTHPPPPPRPPPNHHPHHTNYDHNNHPAGHDENFAGLTFTDAVDAVADRQSLRDECDALVALTHIGTKKDRVLAEKAPRYDVIVGGHSHDETNETVGGVLVTQTGKNLDNVGVTVLRFRGDELVEKSFRLVPLAGYEPAPAYQRMVEGYYSDPALRAKVADLRGRLDKTGLANVFTEAVREAGKADVGIYHIGGVRLDSLAGEVVAADIYNLDPFGSKLVTAEMTADELARLVKTKFNDTVNLDESHRIDIYMTTPYVIRTDERFEAQSVVFPELKPGRRYRVAMGDYIFKTYSGLDYTDGAPTGTLLTDVLDSYLRARSPLAPDNEPRQRIE